MSDNKKYIKNSIKIFCNYYTLLAISFLFLIYYISYKNGYNDYVFHEKILEKKLISQKIDAKAAQVRTDAVASAAADAAMGAAVDAANAAQYDSRRTYYSDCDEAHAEGVSDITTYAEGYRPELDADNDGLACEPYDEAYRSQIDTENYDPAGEPYDDY